jgi:hypothetical protein
LGLNWPVPAWCPARTASSDDQLHESGST